MPSEQKAEVDAQADTLASGLPDDIVKAAMCVTGTASKAKIGIATAESCTGGLLASLLTDIEGASNIFDRGFVAYSNAAKCDLLGLDPKMIDACGAVSERAARAMAEGALQRADAQVAIAITGFAGPGAPEDEPGLVHFACSGHGVETRHVIRHFGDIGRGATRIESLRVALRLLSEMLPIVAKRTSQGC